MEFLIVLILVLPLYFVPTIVAVVRQKRNAGAIAAVNIFLGWLIIGWVVALAWALTYEAPVHQMSRRGQPPQRIKVCPGCQSQVGIGYARCECGYDFDQAYQ